MAKRSINSEKISAMRVIFEEGGAAREQAEVLMVLVKTERADFAGTI